MLIPLTKDKYTIIDDEDYPVISEYKWYCSYYGYAVTCGGKVKMHRMILNLIDSSFDVDHINGDRLDNRKINLRVCNSQQNLANSKISKANKSGYKGVFWSKEKQRWTAQIKFNGKSTYIGYFTDAKDAAIAYNKKAAELFGEFARLNVIDGGTWL